MFISWLLACTGSDPVDPAADPGPSLPIPPDQAQLERVELDWSDPSRDTPALGGAPGASGRDLHTWVWIGPSPGEEAVTRPLLVMAHGIDGHPTKFDAFASALAEAGVVVASAAFPVSNGDVGISGSSIPDLPEQPADLRFVLDRLLEGVRDAESPLGGRFDPNRVAALGHSMGGATLLALARLGEGEPRIGAEAYLAAATPLLAAFEGDVDPSGPPTLVIHGLDDPLPAAGSEQLYADLDDPRWYLGIAGAGHSEAIESQEEPPIPARAAVQALVLDLVGQTFLGDAGAVEATLADLAADGHTVLP